MVLRKVVQLFLRVTRRTKEDHEAHLLLNGWLQKRGEVVETWKRRWFTLSETELKWFSSESAHYALGSIQIAEVYQIRSAKSSALKLDKGHDVECTFIVLDNQRTYFLEAESSMRCYEWIQTISELILAHQQSHTENFD
mmetsp:Transcript_2966/g.7368  ORF Transcript_2966/g.7368 Transcript_2966/m.7368 type:complete len:139 (+) Transcript_2966:2-418(+)